MLNSAVLGYGNEHYAVMDCLIDGGTPMVTLALGQRAFVIALDIPAFLLIKSHYWYCQSQRSR